VNGFKQLPEEVITSKLFRSALTHRSAGKDNNERLEFLGDAVLGLVIANVLFEKFPDCNEGDLSRLRAHLVCRRALAELAKEAKLSASLKLGAGEKKSGGHFRASILADCLEAIFGAVYLLKGHEFTAEFIKSLYAKPLDNLPDIDELKDPKTRLQEQLQSRQIDVPDYIVLKEWGEGNDKQFRVICIIRQLDISAEGEEKSKKKAEQLAAKNLLQKLLHK
jgi:ribonuclease-3